MRIQVDYLVLRASVLSALVLVGCPNEDDSLQASATASSTSSTSTTGPGDTSPDTDTDTDIDTDTDTDIGTDTSVTSGSMSSTGSTSGGTTTDGGGLCGDGVLDPQEECDDGDQNSEDGPCTPACTLACGDGVIQGDEECDLGPMNDNQGTCTKECTSARCGDSFLQPGEECDHGDEKNSVEPDKCHPVTCTKNISTCGNGEVDNGEECDASAGDEAVDCTMSCMYVSRTVFVSTGTYNADFGDLDAADQHCRDLALSANLEHSNSFIALLSTSAEPISERIGAFGGEYNDTTSTKVAQGSGGLFSGALQNAIELDQFGQNAMEDNTQAWTGTLKSGASSGATCNDWTSLSFNDFGQAGDLGESKGAWVEASTIPCAFEAHLYCVQNSH